MTDFRAYWGDLLLTRALPAAVFGLFIAYQLVNLYLASGPVLAGSVTAAGLMLLLNQLLLVGFYVLLVVLYATRLPRRSPRCEPLRRLVAVAATFVLLPAILMPVTQPRLLDASAVLLAVGIAYSLLALLYLRRSFAILPEVRRLVTGGPYALSRHPLYLGEVAAGCGLLLPRLSLVAAGLLALLLVGQRLRIGWEEAAIGGLLPDYAGYSRRVPRYLPNPLRLLPAVRAGAVEAVGRGG